MAMFDRALQIASAISTAMDAERQRAASIFFTPAASQDKACSVAGCSRQSLTGGMCNAHYLRLKKGKSLDVPIRARKRDGACAECGAACGVKGGWGLCAKHYRTKRRRAIKSAVVELFGGRCADCGESHPLAVYDFHHVSDKEGSISVLLDNASAADMGHELAKCILLCANCHRVRHANEL